MDTLCRDLGMVPSDCALFEMQQHNHYSKSSKYDDPMKQFKRNQNKMKTKLIEENKLQKQMMDDLIEESRQELKKEMEVFKSKVTILKLKLHNAALDFEAECKKAVDTMISSERIQKVVKSVEQNIKVICSESLDKSSHLLSDFNNHLQESCKKESKLVEKKMIECQKNLQRIHNKQKETVLKVSSILEGIEEEAEEISNKIHYTVPISVDTIISQKVKKLEKRNAITLNKVIKTISLKIPELNFEETLESIRCSSLEELMLDINYTVDTLEHLGYITNPDE
jgi:alpha-glucosidase (family GH31 glycosyl hydrolase)